MPRKPTRVRTAPAAWPTAGGRGDVVYTASDGRKIKSDSRMVLVPKRDGRSIVIEVQQILP